MTAAVQIALDTQAPKLALDVPTRVAPPDELTVLVTTDELLSSIVVRFIDAAGASHDLGSEWIDASTLRVVVPTVEASSGDGLVVVEARDLAGNLAGASAVVYVDLPALFDATLEIGGAFAMTLDFDGAFEAEVSMAAGFEARLEVK